MQPNQPSLSTSSIFWNKIRKKATNSSKLPRRTLPHLNTLLILPSQEHGAPSKGQIGNVGPTHIPHSPHQVLEDPPTVPRPHNNLRPQLHVTTLGAKHLIPLRFNLETRLGCLIALLENMFSKSVIYHFLHWFLTDVESADVECIIVNISTKKSMLTLNLQHRLFK